MTLSKTEVAARFYELYVRSGGTNVDLSAALDELFRDYGQAKVLAQEFQNQLTAERKRSAELEKSNELLADRSRELSRLVSTLEATTDFVVISDTGGKILFLNAAAKQMAGISEGQDLSEVRAADFFSPRAKMVLLDEAMPAAMDSGSWEGESTIIGEHGIVIPVSQVVLAHRAESGDVEFLSTIARDISERKRFETTLVELANHDGLTSLFNRRRFVEELELELARARRVGATVGMLFLDLDRFKSVNDELRHGVGDNLLIRLAYTLRSTLGDTAVTSRFGGDEFAILLRDTSEAEVMSTAGRVLDAVREIRLPAGGQIVRITPSIGVCLYPDDGLSADELLARSDIAMYSAKIMRDNVKRFDEASLADFETAISRATENTLRDALENDDILLYAQPIRNLTTDETQWEVLARIQLPDGRIALLASFLGAAERSELIHLLDREIVRKSIEFLAIQETLGQSIVLEVNLSGKAFEDEHLLPSIREQLATTGVSPASLIFEITETATIKSIFKAQEFIGEVRSIGCRFAIDDFAAGLSSYYYLKTLPVDFLKIDGSFIRNLPHDVADQHLVRSMVELARGLGKKTIAEFVNDQETVDLLREYGVEYGQGFFLGEPRPIELAVKEQLGKLEAA